MSDLTQEPSRDENSDGVQKPAYRAADAFGEDTNSYAYPSRRGLSGYGVASAICGLCGFFCMLTVFVGIGVGIAGLVRDRRDVLCYIGIALSVFFLVFNIIAAAKFCGSTDMSALFS